MPLPVLTATLSNLIVITYEVDPAVLAPYLPAGTELDYFENKTFASILAFSCTKTKLFGILPILSAIDFEEVNLRFYVRRKIGDEVRRGVVFAKEIVPSALIAIAARSLYNEPYEIRPMFHSTAAFSSTSGGSLSYGVTNGTHIIEISATTTAPLQSLREDSFESFILERYWVYAGQARGTTSECRIEHKPWQYWPVASTSIDGDITSLYPQDFKSLLNKTPVSAFVAQGSPVALRARKIFHPVFKMNRAPGDDVRGWVLYDGACGFCAWWVPRFQRNLKAAGFAIAPLQTEWVRETIALPPEQLTSDIRVLSQDGTLISGADAYIYGMTYIWWARPLGFIMGLPGCRWLIWKLYKLFNRNRFVISKICGLPNAQG